MDMSWLSEKIWIQLLLLVGIAVVTVLLTRSTSDARHQAVRRVLLVGFVLVAASAILVPTWLSHLAALLGVGRGTDLLLYLLVIAFLSFIATSFRRVKMLDRRITDLTRELALLQARLHTNGLPTAHDVPAETASAGADASTAGAAGKGASETEPAGEDASTAGAEAKDPEAESSPGQ